MAKILVVDDEHDMIWALTNVLLSENHTVVSVDSGEEALKKIEQTPLELVLLDFRLPGMDGIQVLEKIKLKKPELPVIMVTGYGGIEEAVQAIKLGATDYVSKPFDNDHLIEVINKALQIDTLKKGVLFEKRVVEKLEPLRKPVKGQNLSSISSIPFKGINQNGSEIREEKIVGNNKKTKIFVFVFISLSFLLTLGILTKKFYKLESQKIEYVIPNSKVSGLAIDGETLWASDWFTQTIYQYQIQEKKLVLIKSYSLNGFHLTGIAPGNNSLYTCDSWKKTIVRHHLNNALDVRDTYPSPGPNPSGLYYDGKYLWSCDATTRKIYQHALDDKLTVIATYESPATFPVGLFHNKDSFFSASALGGKIFMNSMQERFKLEKTYIFKEAVEKGKQISAFTIQENNAWIALEGESTIIKKSLSELEQTSP